MSDSASPLRQSLPAIGGLLACAACCAAPLLLPALLGAGITTGLGAWLLSRGELGLATLAAALGCMPFGLGVVSGAVLALGVSAAGMVAARRALA